MTTYQLFPDLPPAVEAALRSSIERHGVLVPVLTDQHGNILDGHHRTRIAAELGVEVETAVVAIRDEAHGEEVAATLNLDRRHLDVEQRRQVVADLRSEGHSERAIAEAVGVSPATVHRDIESTASHEAVPDRIVGRDGKSRPSTRPTHVPSDDDLEAMLLEPETEMVPASDIEPGDVIVDDHGEAHPISSVEDHGEEVALIDADGDASICAGDNPVKRMPQKAGHPAPFTPALIPLFAELLDGYGNVLDPFAGTGRIHQVADLIDIETVGVELEPEWAEMHPRTMLGDATALAFEDGSFESVCTSPAYGNRMADHHNAQDGSHRQTYRHMLGRDLTGNNAGGMQWGADYRHLHEQAWKEAARILVPHGRLIVNISDHVRDGKRVAVAGWHVETLVGLGFTPTDIIPIATPRMRAGANADARVDAELVIVFKAAA